MGDNKGKEDGGKQGNLRQPKPWTKVEISNLPPGLSEDQFRSTANQIVHIEDCVDYFFYFAGKTSSTKRVKSFCILNFKNPQDLFEFAQKFNGHLFVDSKGVEYPAQVEYAPFQRLPKPRKKADARQGTIAQDEDYRKFTESLSVPVTPLLSAEAQLEKRISEEKEMIELNGGKAPAIMSPLLMELLERKKLRTHKKSLRDERRKGERRKKRKEAKGKAAEKINLEKRERVRKRGERKDRKSRASEANEKGSAGRQGNGEAKKRTKAVVDQKAPSWVAIQKQLAPGEVRIAVREKPLASSGLSSLGGGGGPMKKQIEGHKNFAE